MPPHSANAPPISIHPNFHPISRDIFRGIFLALVPTNENNTFGLAVPCAAPEVWKGDGFGRHTGVDEPCRCKITPWGVSGFDAPLTPCPFLAITIALVKFESLPEGAASLLSPARQRSRGGAEAESRENHSACCPKKV